MRGDGDYQLLWRRSGAKAAAVQPWRGGASVPGSGGDKSFTSAGVSGGPITHPRRSLIAAITGAAPPSPFRPRLARLPAGRRADAVS